MNEIDDSQLAQIYYKLNWASMVKYPIHERCYWHLDRLLWRALGDQLWRELGRQISDQLNQRSEL